jgi:hypothetical protein
LSVTLSVSWSRRRGVGTEDGEHMAIVWAEPGLFGLTQWRLRRSSGHQTNNV